MEQAQAFALGAPPPAVYPETTNGIMGTMPLLPRSTFDPAVVDQLSVADLDPEVLSLLGMYPEQEQQHIPSPTKHQPVAERKQPYKGRIPESRANWPEICPAAGCNRRIDATKKGDFSVTFQCCGNCARKIRNKRKRAVEELQQPLSPALSSGSSSHSVPMSLSADEKDDWNPFSPQSPFSDTSSCQQRSALSLNDEENRLFLEELNIFFTSDEWKGTRLARLRACVEREFAGENPFPSLSESQDTMRGLPTLAEVPEATRSAPQPHTKRSAPTMVTPEPPSPLVKTAPKQQHKAAPSSTKLPFEHGAISREEATSRLNTRGQAGSFLLRKSRSSFSGFTLSVRGIGGVRHIRVVDKHDGYAFNPEDPGMPSLHELVQANLNKDLANVENPLESMILKFPMVCEDHEYEHDGDEEAPSDPLTSAFADLSVEPSEDDDHQEHVTKTADAVTSLLQRFMDTRKNPDRLFLDLVDLTKLPAGKQLHLTSVKATSAGDSDGLVVSANGTFVPEGKPQCLVTVRLAVVLKDDCYRIGHIKFTTV